jgi:hypothetical protein
VLAGALSAPIAASADSSTSCPYASYYVTDARNVAGQRKAISTKFSHLPAGNYVLSFTGPNQPARDIGTAELCAKSVDDTVSATAFWTVVVVAIAWTLFLWWVFSRKRPRTA